MDIHHTDVPTEESNALGRIGANPLHKLQFRLFCVAGKTHRAFGESALHCVWNPVSAGQVHPGPRTQTSSHNAKDVAQ
ncbi:MAG: Uncharacterised protein [Cellulomonadaceae bacterium TMED98]|nr:MAG: Uncharacterised protein [Cellulomonadaceae bacterium TMED98]